jgi:hypothetical protein
VIDGDIPSTCICTPTKGAATIAALAAGRRGLADIAAGGRRRIGRVTVELRTPIDGDIAHSDKDPTAGSVAGVAACTTPTLVPVEAGVRAFATSPTRAAIPQRASQCKGTILGNDRRGVDDNVSIVGEERTARCSAATTACAPGSADTAKSRSSRSRSTRSPRTTIAAFRSQGDVRGGVGAVIDGDVASRDEDTAAGSVAASPTSSSCSTRRTGLGSRVSRSANTAVATSPANPARRMVPKQCRGMVHRERTGPHCHATGGR